MTGLLQQEPWLHCYAVRTVDWPVDSQNALYTWGQTFITKYYTETSRGQVSSHRLCVLCGKALLSNTWLLLHCWWSAVVGKCSFEVKWMKEFDFKWFDCKWMNWIKWTYCSLFVFFVMFCGINIFCIKNIHHSSKDILLTKILLALIQWQYLMYFLLSCVSISTGSFAKPLPLLHNVWVKVGKPNENQERFFFFSVMVTPTAMKKKKLFVFNVRHSWPEHGHKPDVGPKCI